MTSRVDKNGGVSKEAPLKIVSCPRCKKDSVYDTSNLSRPFCSPSCKAIDLGAWASEDFRVEDMDLRDESDFTDARLKPNAD